MFIDIPHEAIVHIKPNSQLSNSRNTLVFSICHVNKLQIEFIFTARSAVLRMILMPVIT